MTCVALVIMQGIILLLKQNKAEVAYKRLKFPVTEENVLFQVLLHRLN